MAKALVNKKYKLERFQGKGGWTYAAIPEVLQNKHSPFGWVRVRGSIDGVEIKSYRLQPMGNGKLFLPVKAEIRKKIGKKEGDWVKIILYKDDSPLDIPEELVLCLMDEPGAYHQFLKFTEGVQKEYISWIYSAKRSETRIERIAKTITKTLRGEKLNTTNTGL
jgi:hypothetical protein